MAAFLAVVAACGDETPETMTSITVTGVPSTALAPLQTAQFGAQATYSNGSVRDVTTTASWNSTDTKVLTVSSAGLVTATGPGQAQVVVSFGGATGQAGVQVVALPAAYFIHGVEYAFEYRLDAQGRVDIYSIAQRPERTYAQPPESDINVTNCSGSLSGDYGCTRLPVNSGASISTTFEHRKMGGVAGRLARETRVVDVSDANWSCGRTRDTIYSYAARGLANVSYRSSNTFHVVGYPGCYTRDSSTRTSTLDYDSAGRLVRITSGAGEDCVLIGEVGSGPVWSCTPVPTSSVVEVTTDSQGRLQRATDGTTVELWSYGGAGLIEKYTSTRTDPQGTMLSTSAVTYTSDSQGWMQSRRVRMESRDQPTTETVDTYAIVRSGNRVVEEAFTQAEPGGFYLRGVQRVRYDWNRLPTEPTFVPHALTGVNGADYLGILSSHHRDPGTP